MNEKIQIFFMPFAGGSMNSFDVLLPYLEGGFEVHVFEYAGHGARRKEPFYDSLGTMAGDAALFVNAHRNSRPYAIFGYSMGSLVVYEMFAGGYLTQPPAHIFLAAHDSPDSQWEGKYYYGLQEDDFIDILRKMGGFDRVDDKTLHNKFFQKMYLQPIKEDYRLLAEYEMSKRVVLPAKVTMFYAPADISRERIELWKPFMPSGSRFLAMGEKHFFLQSHGKEIVEQMKENLRHVS